MWASSILLSYGTVNFTMMSCCVEDEWVTISGLSLVSLIILRWLSYSRRCAETCHSSHLSSRHVLWFVDMTALPCHDLATPSVVNITASASRWMLCPLAIHMAPATSLRTRLFLHVGYFAKAQFGQADNFFLSPIVPCLHLGAGDRILI